jgi:hypothetical protein
LVDLFISYGAKGTRRELRLLRTNRLGPATDEAPPEVDATDITEEEGSIQQVECSITRGAKIDQAEMTAKCRKNKVA